jgi:hypothetical protein
MNEALSSQAWWPLHLRKVRGEALTDEERRVYEAELARLDGAAPSLGGGIGALRKLRGELVMLARTNQDLRSRINELDCEIRVIEKSLSDETREALGVKE